MKQERKEKRKIGFFIAEIEVQFLKGIDFYFTIKYSQTPNAAIFRFVFERK